MADPITVSPADVDEAVFVAIATAGRDAVANVLAGISSQIATDNGDLSAAALAQAIQAVQDAIVATPPDPAPQPSGDVAR
jgi:hypothetical protein